MKKRLLAVALCVCTAFSAAACGNKDANEETTGKENKTEGKITLGEYKGIKVDASLATVSDEEVQEYLQSVLNNCSETEELTEGVLEKDGKAKISYTSTVDGEEYKNAEGANLNLTETGFDVEGFVDGLIGHSVGETVELDLTLAEDFSDTEVAGKNIHFTVTIEAKINTVVPEFTDDFVKGKFDYLGLATQQDLLDYLRNEILINQIYSEIWQEVLDNATVESYDSDDLEAMAEECAEYQEYMIYAYTGYDLSTYLSAIGQSEDEFMEEMRETAKNYLKQEMLIKAIAEEEGIEMTDELYQEKMLEYAKSYGCDTVAEFEETNADRMTKEDFEYEILAYEVIEMVCESVEYVENLGLRNEQETSSENNTGDTTENTSEETTAGEE